MDINITLIAEGFDEELSQDLTRELCTTINKETEFYASLGNPESEIIPSLNEPKSNYKKRGDPITIGAIVLAVLGTGGGAAALINVFKSFVDKSKELSIRLKKQNGDEVEISSKNIDLIDIKSMMQEFLTKE